MSFPPIFRTTSIDARKHWSLGVSLQQALQYASCGDAVLPSDSAPFALLPVICTLCLETGNSKLFVLCGSSLYNRLHHEHPNESISLKLALDDFIGV